MSLAAGCEYEGAAVEPAPLVSVEVAPVDPETPPVPALPDTPPALPDTPPVPALPLTPPAPPDTPPEGAEVDEPMLPVALPEGAADGSVVEGCAVVPPVVLWGSVPVDAPVLLGWLVELAGGWLISVLEPVVPLLGAVD